MSRIVGALADELHAHPWRTRRGRLAARITVAGLRRLNRKAHA